MIGNCHTHLCRLKDAGYGEKHLTASADADNVDEPEANMELEVKSAPWNTTQAYVSAIKNKCLLDTTGVADPTGCNEAFSYVRVSTRRHEKQQYQPHGGDQTTTSVEPAATKKLVTGTNADLRKLPLKDAKQMLREFNVSETEVMIVPIFD